MTAGAPIRGFGAGLALLFVLLISTGFSDARADTSPLKIDIGYIGEAIPEPEPLSLVEVVAKDEGVAGARIAMVDDNTTGKFLKQTYQLTEKIIPAGGDLHQAAQELNSAGIKLIIASLSADHLLELAAFP